MSYQSPIAKARRGRQGVAADWDQVYAEQLALIHDYFCRRGVSRSDAEHLTACVFSRAWPNRHRYRNHSAGFDARLLASAYEVAAESALLHGEQSGRADAGPAPEFSAKLRASLEAQELTQQLHRRQVKLYALMAGLLTVAVLVLAIPPTREFAGRLLEQQSTQFKRLLAAATLDHNRQSPGAIQGPLPQAEEVEEFAAVDDEAWLDQEVAIERQASGNHAAAPTPTRAGKFAATELRAQPPAAQAAVLARQQGGEVRIGGHRLSLSLLTPAIEASRGVRSVRITRGLSSEAAFKEFCRGQLDVVATSRPIAREQRASCGSAAIGFIELPVAYAAIAILANYENVWADPLTLETLVKMLDADAEDSPRWSDLDSDWPAQPVSLHLLREGWNVSEFFDEITDGRALHLMNGVLQRHRDAADVIAAVQRDRHAIAAIPYSYYATDESRLLSHAKLVRVADRFGNLVRPSKQSIVSRYYEPLSRVVFLYVNAQSALDPKVRGLVEEVLEHGTEAAGAPIFMALEPTEYERALQNLRALELGSAFEPDQRDGLTVAEILQRNARPR